MVSVTYFYSVPESSRLLPNEITNNLTTRVHFQGSDLLFKSLDLST